MWPRSETWGWLLLHKAFVRACLSGGSVPATRVQEGAEAPGRGLAVARALSLLGFANGDDCTKSPRSAVERAVARSAFP